MIDDIERVEVDEEEIEQFLPEVYRKLEWLDKEELIKRVVSREFGRFLQYYANAPEIEEPADKPKGEKGKRGRNAEEGFVRLFLNLGKLDGFYAKEVMKLVNDHVKGKVEVGRIDLMKSFCFLRGGRGGGRACHCRTVQSAGQGTQGGCRSCFVSTVLPKTTSANASARTTAVEANARRTVKRNVLEKADKKLDKNQTRRLKKPINHRVRNVATRLPVARNILRMTGNSLFSDGTPGKGNDLIGEEPDFSEEGWARRYPKKKNKI